MKITKWVCDYCGHDEEFAIINFACGVQDLEESEFTLDTEGSDKIFFRKWDICETCLSDVLKNFDRIMKNK